MNSLTKGLQGIVLSCSLLLAGPAAAEKQYSMTIDEIMKNVDIQVRRTFETMYSKVKLSTCKYTVKNGKIRCNSKPRLVMFENIQKHADRNKNDSRSLAVILEPIADKGVGMLTWEYDDRGKDNENWIYLSDMGKVHRLISNGENAGSVFGSEFSLEDTETPEARNHYDFTYTLLGEEVYEGRDVWKVEYKPTPQKAEKSKIEKLIVWIDKEKYHTMKEDVYRGGRIYKQRFQRKIEKIDGVWVPRLITATNLISKRVSQLHLTEVQYHMVVPDEFLTQRTLTDFAYRERSLKEIRQSLRKPQIKG